MTNDERKHVQKMLLALADLYGRQLSAPAVGLMSDALMDLDGKSVIEALNKYMRDPASRSFPMPGAIRAMIVPEVTGDQVALEAANRIVEAMGKYGWTNPEKAREFMGEIAWEVVKRDGGWAALCERTNNDDLPILKAQWRELAKVVRIRQEQKPSVPFLEGSRQKQLEDR